MQANEPSNTSNGYDEDIIVKTINALNKATSESIDVATVLTSKQSVPGNSSEAVL